MAKCFSNSTETRDELSTTCNLNKSCFKMPMLHLYTTASEQAAKTNIVSVVRIQLFSIMHG